MSGYLLYGYAGSGSTVVEAALTEASIPFRFHELNVDEGDLAAEAFRAINPRQQVPALRLPDGSVVTEVPAILNHLADAHPESGLAPQPGTSARAQHDRWLAFLHANLYEAILRLFYSERYTTDPGLAAGVKEAARAYAIRHVAIFAEAIGEGPFLFGEKLSAVDLLAWMLTSWMDPADIAAASSKLVRLTTAVAGRPGLREVVARNAATDAEPATPPEDRDVATPAGQIPTADSKYLALLLQYYEEEISGEVYYRALADMLPGMKHKEKMILLAEVERKTAEIVRPLIEHHGLAAASSTDLTADGIASAKTGPQDWRGMIDSMRTSFPKYITQFEELEMMAPAQDVAILKRMTEHEVVVIEFLERETAGDAASTEPLVRFICSPAATQRAR